MGNIVDRIVERARSRVDARKAERPLEQVAKLAERMIGGTGVTGACCTFQEAVGARGLSVIAEIKQASPLGVIADDFPYLDIAYDFEAGEADAVSCVTEPDWFRGSDDILIEVRDEVSVPILHRDFVVDPYQIYEARLLGADAVTLMCALFSDEELRKCLAICNKLNIDALVVAHDEGEVARAVASEARVVGVSNRNLGDFSVDPARAARLCASVPDDRLYVAIGGVSSIEDARRARDAGADGVLVGEFLLRIPDSDDRQAVLREMREIA